MALQLLWARCSPRKTYVQISYSIPRRPPAQVLPTIIAQICLKHPWIISIWLIIHGPACWATVNKVTLFFIWLHTGSHVSRVHNDRYGRDTVVPAILLFRTSICFNAEPFCWFYAIMPSRIGDLSLFVRVLFPPFGCSKGAIQSPLFLWGPADPIADMSPRVCSSNRPQTEELVPVSCLRLPLRILSAIDSDLSVSQSLGQTVRLHMAIQRWNEPWGA